MVTYHLSPIFLDLEKGVLKHMQKRETNPSEWVKEAILDILSDNLEERAAVDSEPIQKQAVQWSLLPGALVGTLAGGYIAKRDVDRNSKIEMGNAVQRALREQNKKFQDVGSDYYTQARNILSDLRIIFTPINVIYVLKGTTIETIDVDEMNEKMKERHSVRDEEYFRNALLNRMMLESQLAEQMFTKRLLEKNDEMLNHIKKQGSVEDLDDTDPEYPPQVYNPYELKNGLRKLAALFQATAKSESLDKYAAILVNDPDNWMPSDSEANFNDIRPLTEVTMDLGEKLAFFSIFGHSDRKYSNPGYLSDHVFVSFLPDRVVFTVDNMVITQMTAFDLNDDGFDKFKKKDQNYFRRLFSKHVASPLEKINNTADTEIEKDSELALGATLDKEAAGDSGAIQREIFVKDDIHPQLYDIILTNAFGAEWTSWDSDVVLKNIEDYFGVEKVGGIALDKIQLIRVLRTSVAPFNGYLVFEKFVRSFNNRSVDFGMSESNISLGEVVFTIRLMGKLIEATDSSVYDNFNNNVFEYIRDTLGDNGYRITYPATLNQNEKAFYSLLNTELLDYWNSRSTQGIPTSERMSNLKSTNRVIQLVSASVIDKKRGSKHLDQSEIVNLVKDALRPYNIINNPFFENVIAHSVIDNIAVDVYIDHKESVLKDHIKTYVVV